MLLGLEVLVDLAVDFDVLEAAVENDEDFSVDGPVVQVGNVSFKYELECRKRADLVLVLAVHTLQQIYR